MNEYLAKTIQIYEQHEIDFHGLLNWHLCHGVVISHFDGFAMGFYCRKEDPTSAVQFYHSDTLFVTMCCGDMQKCLESFKYDFEFITFQRSFKNSPRVRTYPMETFFKKLK
jgi:hypothetical protein